MLLGVRFGKAPQSVLMKVGSHIEDLTVNGSPYSRNQRQRSFQIGRRSKNAISPRRKREASREEYLRSFQPKNGDFHGENSVSS
jgi:hypothetical protein